MEKDWNDTLLTAEDKLTMLEQNPYNTGFGSFSHESFNKRYIIAFEAGVYSLASRIAKLLHEKGMEKEEIRQLLNKAFGKEKLKKSENDR